MLTVGLDSMEKLEVNKILQEVCDKQGWSVQLDSEVVDSRYRYTLSTSSKFGQDVCQEIVVEDYDDEYEISNALYDLWQEFDPERETMLWVDEWGRGKRGAPDLRDCLADMDDVDRRLEELQREFSKMI